MQNQPGRENQFEGILRQTIKEKLHSKKAGALRYQDVLLPVFQEVLAFSEGIVAHLEINGQSPDVACKSGCNYCCHSQVNIIPIEALLISAFIKKEFTVTQMGALNTGIAKARSMTAGKTLEQVYAIKDDLPCLFLKFGKCSIYKIRPSICRSWNSLDSAACKTAYDSVDIGSSITGSPARNYIFGTTRALFEELSQAFSLQSSTLMLHNAIGDCLANPDPLGQWTSGKDVFRYG